MAGSGSFPASTRTYTVFRVVKAGVDPLSTLGSQANGGRYNDRGVSGILYTSLDKSAAIAEVIKGLRSRGVDPKAFGPDEWWVYEIRVLFNRVIDLDDPVTRSSLGVTTDQLIGNDTSVTRKIGNYARENSFQAMIAPSAALPEKNNLVLLLDFLPSKPQVISSTAVNLSAE